MRSRRIIPRVRDTLRRARDANRRPDTYMQRVFTLRRTANALLVGVDAEENAQSAARPGEAYRDGQAVPLDIAEVDVGKDFINDEFGSVLRAHAPVRNRSGQIIGAVVVEAPSTWVDLKMRPIRISALAAMFLACLMAVPQRFTSVSGPAAR